ncbi:sensor histidine kinase [Ornithinicoccus halotolerans]|uniref:sensor histidine kinase n=1 Tax=Ornithinicoccus halotolerans TaxID=1748220 RepID=UPI0012957A86|nr:ATP-binding protein [Ornithinicoccus halotolerans]
MNALSAGLLGALTGLLVGVVAALLLLRLGGHGTQNGHAGTDDQSGLPEGLAAVLGALRSSAIVLGPGETVLHASASTVAYGLARDRTLVHPELVALAREVLRDGVVREVELELSRGRLGGGLVHVGVRVAPIREDVLLLLIEDRTAARRVEEVRRDFVINVSHELKTPVGGITLLAEAIADAADDPEAVQRFAGRMQVETERLGRLVSEIIDLSRLQTTAPLEDQVLVDVTECARTAVDHTRLLAGDREVTVSATADRSRLRVYADPELLTTAIRNLVANAIAYSEDGTRVAVVTRRHEDLVEVAVSDQGSGIPPGDQERIFERFYRVDTARSRSTGGTGLGLSIVKHICANLGGDVTVWSQEGHGSTFTIRLPAAADDDDRPLGSAAPASLRRRTVTAPAGQGRITSSTEALSSPPAPAPLRADPEPSQSRPQTRSHTPERWS